uniref:Uncharacterized protein n=1 Tax=Rhizophora mucronata TaxID=61149 RepID=A0A2P2JAC7_RHIMU
MRGNTRNIKDPHISKTNGYPMFRFPTRKPFGWRSAFHSVSSGSGLVV